ncbi:MAG: DUF5712 family protein [Tannerella sp.]|jgi:hypothetical protein|nr:DUF5712 family protein [Tannerella sp.]
MYIAISRAKTSSCGGLANYLCKEERGRDNFFSAHKEGVCATDVITEIDSNAVGKGLKDKDAKFFSIVVSPSADELKTLGVGGERLKDYVRSVMVEYAAMFNRENKNGKPVTADDFVWFAKTESARSYGKGDIYIRHNEKYLALQKQLQVEWNAQVRDYLKEQLSKMGGLYILKDDKPRFAARPEKDDVIITRGLAKFGDQRHVHIIVSRCHRTERRSFSPLANSRGGKNELNGQQVKIGFDRQQFASNCETIFDLKFDHNREVKNSVAMKFNKKYYDKILQDKLMRQLLRSAGIKVNFGTTQMETIFQRNPHLQEQLLKNMDDKMKNKLAQQFLRGAGINSEFSVSEISTVVQSNPYLREQFLQGMGIDVNKAQGRVMQGMQLKQYHEILKGANGLKSAVLAANLPAKIISKAAELLKKTITQTAFSM